MKKLLLSTVLCIVSIFCMGQIENPSTYYSDSMIIETSGTPKTVTKLKTKVRLFFYRANDSSFVRISRGQDSTLIYAKPIVYIKPIDNQGTRLFLTDSYNFKTQRWSILAMLLSAKQSLLAVELQDFITSFFFYINQPKPQGKLKPKSKVTTNKNK